jgi:primosomal protein N'
VVWDAEPNKKATLAVTEALTLTPLVRAPHRRLIEWLSEEGICSLSTALYVWLPAALRHLPLTKSVREALASWDANQPTALEVAKLKQHLILTPSQREDAEASLRVKYDKAFTSTFLDTTPAQEFTTWLAIAQGRCTLASGRERALYAPWVNLRHCTVIEPEDISFHSGQSPYVNLVDAALVLAEASKAEPTLRTNLPVNAAQRVWPAAQSFPLPQTTVELTDLRKERLLNEPLLRSIRHTVAQLHHVVILYNAHDRPRARGVLGNGRSLLRLSDGMAVSKMEQIGLT